MSNLIRFIIILSLFLPASTIAYSDSKQQVFTLYDQFTEVTHLNSFKNIQQFKKTITKIESSQFDGVRAPFYAYAAKLSNNNGDLATAHRLLDQAIDSLPDLKHDDLLIDTLDFLSSTYFYMGDYANAISYLQTMESSAYKIKDSRGHVIALNRLALNYLELGFHELAIPILKNAIKIAKQTNDKNSEFFGLLYLVNAYIKDAKVNPQITLDLINTTQSVITSSNIDDGYIPRLKGIVHQQLKDYDQALVWLKSSLNTAENNNDVRLLRMVHSNLAHFYIETKQIDLAKTHALLSLDFANNINHKNSIATLDLLLSNIYQLEGNIQKALEYQQRYTDFITSGFNKNVISLLSMMNNKIDNFEQQQKITTLENSVLLAQLQTQKAYNEQFTTFMSIIIVTIFFIILTIVYFIRNRLLSMKVKLSMKDTLTGAYGRSYLPHYLPSAKARLIRTKGITTSFGVIAIDCDDFKLINKSFGHAGGDLALKLIVSALMEQIRANDYLFRWGGDEFVLMCEDVSIEQLHEIASRLTIAVNKLSINYDEKVIKPTISVGYALHKKEDEFDLGALLKRADQFLYQTKDAGKNGFIGA